MKPIFPIMILAVTTFGCASGVYERQQAHAAAYRGRLPIAIQGAIVNCGNKKVCDKAFSLTKIYIQEKSDMKIQFSDDTIVSTYNPIKYANVGISATRTPSVGESSTITISVSCAGMYTDDLFQINRDRFFVDCARRMVPIYEDFRSFVESRTR